MKKTYLVALFVSAVLAFSLAGCGSASTASSSYTVEAKTFPMRVQLDSKDKPRDDEVTLYFLNGGEIPYVALSEYMPFVGSVYGDEQIGISAAEYEITHPAEGQTLVARTDNPAMMTVDADKDTIEFLGLDYFVLTPGSTMLTNVISLSENGRGGVSNLLKSSEEFSYGREGETLLEFDMAEYGIDLVEKDGECYVPLQTVADMLIGPRGILAVFNGEKLFVGSPASKLYEEALGVEPRQMSEEFAAFNYNELRFALDKLYGLKSGHGIDDFGEYFGSTGLIEGLAGTDPAAFDAALKKLTVRYFDDGHSAVIQDSCFADAEASGGNDLALMFEMGTSNDKRSWEGMRLKVGRSEYYPDYDTAGQKQPWLYEEVGDTAIVTFDGFDAKKKDYYKDADLKNPADAIELISYANSRIMRKDSPVKNVVVDLSNNGGGAADAAIFLMSWLNGGSSPAIGVSNTLTGAQSFAAYRADVNLDGEFDSGTDTLPNDMNKYILTSNASFSCANLVPVAMRGTLGTALIGQTSGGGACTVRYLSTASGTVFCCSGPEHLCSIVNGSMQSADQGAVPDAYINKLSTFYDRQKLVDFIHDLP